MMLMSQVLCFFTRVLFQKLCKRQKGNQGSEWLNDMEYLEHKFSVSDSKLTAHTYIYFVVYLP